MSSQALSSRGIEGSVERYFDKLNMTEVSISERKFLKEKPCHPEEPRDLMMESCFLRQHDK